MGRMAIGIAEVMADPPFDWIDDGMSIAADSVMHRTVNETGDW